MMASCSDDVGLPTSLDDAKITGLPSTAFYIPNFITEEEERQILDKVYSFARPPVPGLSPRNSSRVQIASAPKPRWKQLSHRRLQTWPSDLVQNILLDSPLPVWLSEPVITRLLSIPRSSDHPGNLFTDSPHKGPNHVLINEYPPGIGIMPHKACLHVDVAVEVS